MLRKKKQQTEKRKGAGVISGKNTLKFHITKTKY
jgi:hypothetical protein